ncbi:class I SAM-dependent methyltransferase, partial [Staphylococcus carnosus]
MTNNRNDFTLRLLEDANIHPGMRVLDVGCGPGEVTGLLAALVGDSGKVIGIDTNTQLLNLAKQNHSGENIEYREADIYDLPQDLG